MKLTLGWLKTHLDTPASLEEIAAKLTMLGLEVDGVTDSGGALAPFIVAHVVSAEPHPQADRLRVCVVDTGASRLQVVCGAPNARAGIKGVFAPSGAVIPRSGLMLKPSVIRGVDSNGMLCSGSELGISDDHDGIIELPEDAPIGMAYAAFAGLDDPLLDIKITPNRADCLSVRGIARDLAAAGLGRLKPLDIPAIEGGFHSPIKVSIEDPAACPLFIGRLIRGVTNGPSPKWLADRLLAIGLRPISALVDMTNFITFDLGRPLHVFDAGKLTGDLVVRAARDGEILAALNGKDYALEAGMTAITDDNGVVSLGGVMGGASTGCLETTTDVFIEAALFDSVLTAATGRKLNLQSDARYRFERGIDPEFTADGLAIATRLVLELCGGEPSRITTAGQTPAWRRELSLRPERVASLGGVAVPVGDIEHQLEALGCETRNLGDHLTVVPPSWRADIEGEADLVEEVLRIEGYEIIPVMSLPRLTPLPATALDPAQRRAGLVRRTLASRGLDEAVTYSFMASATLGAGNTAMFGALGDTLNVANPISADLDVMRPSILPNLLQAAARNNARGIGAVPLFEVGPQYRDDTPEGQSLVAAGIRVGPAALKSWQGPARAVDAFDAKADALAALAAAGAPIDNLQTTADPPGWYHPGRAGSLRLGPKTVLAHFGELHPRLLATLGLKSPAVGFEVYLDLIPLAKAKGRTPPNLSPFQPVERDYAFVVDEAITAEQVLRVARGVDKKLIAGVRLFDVYGGPGIAEGRKSVGITVTLQPMEATLTDAEIEGFSATLVAQMSKSVSGALRG